jgi:glutaredoxin
LSPDPGPPAYPAILILGRDDCADTSRVREHLVRRSVPFVYRNIHLDPGADARIRELNGGDRITPTILLGDPEAPVRVLVEPSNRELDEAIALTGLAPS